MLTLSVCDVCGRLERVWGPGDGRPVEELKVAIDQLLQVTLSLQGAWVYPTV